ncbi:hypothetical protein FH972_021547 [Carpinus fangiana]|uniref:NADPH:adrenodoxin oxidoreductase, mitochondrial n=1 Tax=Carpinus fangiana TaxID=176857 RepID=A0A5N6KQ89_9ROSI|nr:hypothetical protein FH972_021547 [Carpinus fangiana]
MLARRRVFCRDCIESCYSSKSWSTCVVRAPVTQHRRHESSHANPRQRPLRLAIVGSGPAGFYAAARVMQKLPDARVDMFERLPVPFGLVRYGVAPDHPEVKNCQERFEEVAQSERFQFVGNVKVGRDIPLDVLSQHYDALLFAYGASQDRALGIAGENLTGIHSARAFVGWYNGLPEFADLDPDLTQSDTAVVIGNGNVALDVARILLSSIDTLRNTDISVHAIEALSKSRVKSVIVAGRRGPMQAAFTIKELRELLTLPSVGFKFEDDSLVPTAEYIKSLPRLEQRKYRFAQLLEKGSATTFEEAKRHWHLMSLASPRSFQEAPGTRNLQSIVFDHNRFKDPNAKFERTASVAPTGADFTVNSGLAFRSIGYKAEALPGMTEELGVTFDTRSGTISNDKNGRAVSADGQRQVPGCYATGWAQTGPTGVIASTMENAFASADSIIHDWESGKDFLATNDGKGWESLSKDSRVTIDKPITWQHWKTIDAAERERGQAAGKVREKFTRVEDMLAVAYAAQP